MPVEERIHVPSSAEQRVADASNVWYWNIILLLCAWLHLRHFTTHSAVNLILGVLRLVFVALGVLSPTVQVPLTLKTAFKCLDLDGNIPIIPVRPSCLWTHHGELAPDATCTRCDAKLFIDNPTQSANNPQPAKPKLQAPYILPSQLLVQLINSTPTMEADLDKWRSRTYKPGQLTCIQDGEVWRTLPDSNGGLFFDNDPDRASASELRIGVTCGFDGFVVS